MTATDLRAWRAAQGLSQRQLGEALGVSIRTLQEWEQGRRRGPPGAILALALAQLEQERAREIAEPPPSPSGNEDFS